MADLESDIASMSLKKNQADELLKIHKLNYENHSVRYKKAYQAWSTLNE